MRTICPSIAYIGPLFNLSVLLKRLKHNCLWKSTGTLVLLLLLSASASAQLFDGYTKWPRPKQTYKRLKAGYGLPYGQFGVNGELGTKIFAGTAGLGMVVGNNITPSVGFSLGTRLYVLPEEKQARPRLSAHYGVNGVFKENNNQRTAIGLAFGVGFEHLITPNVAYDMDVMVPINSTNTARPNNSQLESKAIASIGIGIYFNSPNLR